MQVPALRQSRCPHLGNPVHIAGMPLVGEERGSGGLAAGLAGAVLLKLWGRTRCTHIKCRFMPWNCACNVLLLTVLTVGLSAEASPRLSDLPSNQQVLAFLTQTIDWYRHRVIERQIATGPVDLVFLEDNRPLALEIVRLSFDFARAGAAMAATSAPGNQTQSTANASRSSPDLAQFLIWQNNAELASRQARQEIEDIREKLLRARGADRRKLQAALDTAQSRVAVLQAGSATLQQLVEFVHGFGVHGAGELTSSIDDLARTVPEVTNPTAAASQSQSLELPSIVKPIGPGILSLSSEVSSLGRKLRVLDQEIGRTDTLKQASDALRTPLLASISRRFATETAGNLQISDLGALQEQKTRFDELAASVKALSPVIVALDKQRVLLDAYTSHLKSWRAAAVGEDEKAWKELALRLAGLAVVIGAVIIIGAVARKAVRRHVQDPERRHLMLVTQRVGLWFIIIVVATFAFASDLSSLATFFGLVAAGTAVALQSVILSAVGYFVLVGRRGIRIGDRVQISGVTGDVTDIGWLQFQLKEIDTRTQQPTGNVVTFSNSFVLASSATGLSKLNRVDHERLEAAAKAQH
jgi:Mechanosensitive ion channel